MSGSDLENDSRATTPDSALSLSFKYPWDSPVRTKPHIQPLPEKSRLRIQATSPTDDSDPAIDSPTQPAPLSPSFARGNTVSPENEPASESSSASAIADAFNRIGSNPSSSDQEATESVSHHQNGHHHSPFQGSHQGAGGSGSFGRQTVVAPTPGGPQGPLAKRSSLSMLLTSAASDSSSLLNSPSSSSTGTPDPQLFAKVSPELGFPPQEKRAGQRIRSSSGGSIQQKRPQSGSTPSSPTEMASSLASSLATKTTKVRRNSSSRKRASSSERAPSEYNINESNFGERKIEELPKSKTGPIFESPEKIVPIVMENLKQIRSKPYPYTKDNKFTLPDIEEMNQDNELLELAESFICTVEQLRTKDFEAPKLVLSDPVSPSDYPRTKSKSNNDDDNSLPKVEDEEEKIRVQNQLRQKYKYLAKPQRRLSADMGLDPSDVFDDKLSQSLYELSHACKYGYENDNNPDHHSLGSYETARRFLFTIAQVDVTVSVAQSNFMKTDKSPAPMTRKASAKSAISSHNSTDFTENGDTRDEEHWVIPRIQVYFQVYPKSSNGIELQNNRCYNCGAYIDLGFIRGARYCEYTGKYHCRSCHTNQSSIIPAHVVTKWDFRLYKVSDRAKEFLEMMWKEPVFDISVINIGLYDKARPLLEMKLLRTQLSYVRDFLYTCRLSGSLVQKTFAKNAHLVNFVDMYSMEDFVGIQNGTLVAFVKSATSELISHVFNCELCKSRGFVCEFCHGPDVLYPFQLKTVFQCPNCKSFFHRKCYVASQCPKCLRLEGYRLRAISTITDLKDLKLKT